jgi:lipopolysaccharide/colanic/teichoic acid biosynthesis glycosyltransferase
MQILPGVDSTSSSDNRITPIGKIVRKFKLDELPQLFHVLTGKMSLVGPRPNVWNDVKIYTKEEKELLSIKPGITDFSSIIFSDEGDILSNYKNPDLKYNQLIRPWKSRLGTILHKKKKHSFGYIVNIPHISSNF